MNKTLLCTWRRNILRRILSGIFLIGMFVTAAAQQNRQDAVKGTVLDDKQAPAVGATIVVKGTNRGTIADGQGKFSIEASSRDTLQISLIGYLPQEIPVGSQAEVTVWLKENLLSIEDVVVVGFGVQRKETVTGAINSIGSKEILRSPTANVTNALAGKMAGLTAVQRGGEPGKDGATFKIRGIGTLNEGSESAPLILIDGIERTSLDVIDPNEIETINILKDASATAVYGVRGANGVILVTTKTGQPGRAQVTLTSNFGWQSYTMMPELVNAYEWATLYNEGLAHENSTKAPFPQEALDAWKNHTSPVLYPDVDWVDKLLRKSAPQQQYNVNVSGGSDRTKYFVSFGMLHQEGIYKEYDIDGVDFSVNPDYRRFNLRANLDIDVMKGMTLGLRLGTIFTDGNYPNASTSNIFDYLLRTVPGGGPGLINGKLVTGYSGDDPLENYERRVSNPIFDILEQGYQEYNTSTYNLSADLNYDLGFLVKGLSVRGKVAYDDYGTHRVAYTTGSIPQYTVVVDNDYEEGYRLVKASDETAFGAKESYSTRYRNVYLEGGISYAGQFGRHSVTALALYNQRVQDNPSFQYDLPKGLLGFVGRITYNFDNRYLAEFNAGYNGSENFAEGKRFGFFPAFSLGWILTEEKFIPRNKFLTYAKIRGSYGEVGNDQIGGDRYLYLPPTFVYGSNGYNFGTFGQNSQYYPASAEGSVGNSDVTWERAKKANIGLDLKMFDNQLSFTGDYFWEKRDNILWDYGTVPSIVGTTLSAANLGRVDNKGFELELGWNSKVRNFEYWISGVFSYAKNKIVYMDEAKQAYPYLAQTGYSVGQYKGYINEGFINTDADLENQPAHGWGGDRWAKGELNFIDINGDGIVDTNDRVTIGYGSYPEITFGVNLGFQWKGFEVSALLQGAANVSLYLKQSAVCPLYYTRSAQKWHMGRWTEERYLAGEKITYPRILSDNISSPSFLDQNPLSTFWLYDASYLRLRNLEIAYTLKSKTLKNSGISSIRLYVSGTNLFTITGMDNFDPEAPSGIGSFYPMQKVYNVGVKLVF